MRTVYALGLWLGLMQTVYAQRDLKDIPPVDPEIERKTFILPEGFEANLYVADPKIAKPIHMNFDAQGRLWIASSAVYPHIVPGAPATDEILVVEDADRDGVGEKVTKFVGGLLIPTGVLPGDGGAYVANSTELLHLRDTDGDGQADTRQIVLSGFGTEDTHHILHTLRWGPEGRMYLNQSIYIHSHVETPWGVARLNGGGIWQFRPETMQMEVYMRGLVNSWGHIFTDDGQSFATDGAGGEGINYIVPRAAYFTAVGANRILKGLNPGSPKHCGLEIVHSSALPDDWQGDLITNDFRAHRVCRFKLEESGSGYISREQVEVIKSTHGSFRPVDVKIGPDGAIYVADWYNPIIQHGEVDFRDPRRDHTHGRIWRISYTGKSKVSPPDLVKLSTPELLRVLEGNEQWQREQARQLLKERGQAETLPHLKSWLAGLPADQPGREQLRLQGLWLYQSLLTVEPTLLTELLRSPEHGVRAAATRVIQDWQDRLPDTLDLLEQQVRDEHPRVRLEAVRVLGTVQQPEAMDLAMLALESPMDTWLDYGLWLTARELQAHWLPRLQQGQLLFGGDAQKLTFALQAVEAPGVAQPLLGLINAGKIDLNKQPEVVQLIATLGQPADLEQLLKLAAAAKPEQAAVILQHLANAPNAAGRKPTGDLAPLATLLQSSSVDVKAAAAKCVGVWKVEPHRATLTALALDEKHPLPLRTAAIEGLAQLGGPATVEVFTKLTQPALPLDIRLATVAAWLSFQPEAAARQAVKTLQEVSDEELARQVFASFLSRKDGPAVLAKALLGQELPEDIAKVGLRAVDSSGASAPGLTEALKTAGHVTTGERVLSAEELSALVKAVQEEGDPHRGELVYRQKSLTCMNCHAIGGAGGAVGPDLLSLGASAPVDYLIESILLPSKKIKENYQTLVIADLDGNIHTGIKLRETEDAMILRNAKDEEISVPKANIDEMNNGNSMMPVGLTEKITRRDLVDLVAFMSRLGKVGDFAVGQEPLIRRWRTMAPTNEARYRLNRAGYTVAATDDPAFLWEPAYSQVNGTLPLESIPNLHPPASVASQKVGVGFVRLELDVKQAGPFALKWNDTRGLTAWVDNAPLTLAESTPLNLPVGVHRLTIAVNREQRTTGLRVEIRQVKDSPAQVLPVGGK